MEKMGGILICGLNGSGKTTLGHALSEIIGVRHLDIEQYYFANSGQPYATSRTREEVSALLKEDIRMNSDYILSAVNGDFDLEITASYRLIVFLDAPLALRMDRIRARAYKKFGERVLPGGDMYATEEKFFDFVQQRTTDRIEHFLNSQRCPVLRLDGRDPIAENVFRIREMLTVC